ncbi:MAG: hypothetical protein MUF18_07190 [Fimbriiglobus sp.]|jgi:hypothetical protein|nr:hypothetical protein [Fimbriiglobus sp.]
MTSLELDAARIVWAMSITPQLIDGLCLGDGADLIAGDGSVLALLAVGSITPGGTLQVWVEESSDQTTWSVIPGATLSRTTAGVAVLGVNRQQRYLRIRADVSAGAEVQITAIVAQRRKLLP